MGRVVEAIRETGPNMADETRRELIEDYAALADRFARRAYWEEFVLEADMGVLRRLWRLCKLRVYRRAERVARGDVERLGG